MAAITFKIVEWQEVPVAAVEGASKLARVTVRKTFAGDLEGEGTLEYLMHHLDEQLSTFVGFERVVGTLHGKAGSFVLQHTGTFQKGVATATCDVVEGSGSGDLKGLTGTGGFSSGHAEEYKLTLDYTLA